MRFNITHRIFLISCRMLTLCAAATLFMPIIAYSNTISGYSSAEIKENIQISELDNISFGLISPVAGQAGIVSISPQNDISTINAGHQNALPTHAARFLTTGTPYSNVTISFSNGSLSGAGTPMALKNFTHSAGVSPALNTSGVLDFNVGADLNISSTQANGSYTGNYGVTVNYQ